SEAVLGSAIAVNLYSIGWGVRGARSGPTAWPAPSRRWQLAHRLANAALPRVASPLLLAAAARYASTSFCRLASTVPASTFSALSRTDLLRDVRNCWRRRASNWDGAI